MPGYDLRVIPVTEELMGKARQYYKFTCEGDEDEECDDPFEAYNNLCVNNGAEQWNDRQRVSIFLSNNTTHIIKLWEVSGKKATLKTFAWLSAPALPEPRPNPLPPAKCVLICGTWKAHDGRKGSDIVHATREEVARNLGYKTMELTAAKEALVPYWEGKGFMRKGTTDLVMTKSIELPTSAPAAAGQGPPGGRRRKTRKPRKPRRKTRKARK
jgi:hypothetical protein